MSPYTAARTGLSISAMLDTIALSRKKLYTHTYAECGFELGFGRAGKYSGHAHRSFIDLMYSPAGLHFDQDRIDDLRSPALAVPPGIWLPDVTLFEFFFMKFTPNDGEVILPEKVDRQLCVGSPIALVLGHQYQFDWYPAPAERRTMTFILQDDRLHVEPEGQPNFVVQI